MPETITVIGTGGIIEGNLGTSNVNVNTDAVLDFDGVNDYITIPDNSSLDIAGDWAISAWIKLDSMSGYCRIVGKQDASSNQCNYGIGLENGTDFGAFFNDGSWRSAYYSTDLNTGQWHHVVGQWDDSEEQMFLYINGVLVQTTTLSGAGTPSGNDDPVLIGLNEAGGSEFFNGNIADVRIYDAILTASEIQVLASKINGSSSLGAGTGDLQAWWKLNEGTGTSAADSSANSNTGTATNFAMSGTSSNWLYDAFSVNVQDGGVRLADSGTNSAETLDATETAFTVHDGTQFAAGQIIQVDDERMYIVSIATHVLTVRRGIGGTTAASHSNPVDVYHANATYVSGTTTVTQGKLECLSLTTPHFDGDNDFIELGSQAGDLRLSASNATISAWIYIADVSADDGYKRIIEKSDEGNATNGWGLYTHTDGKVFLDVDGSNAQYSAAGVITDAKWYHIIATFDSTNKASMWINGVRSEGMTGVTTLPPSDTTGARIGSWNHSTAREFKGKIRDVRVYDYAVRDAGAASLYSGSYNVTPLHWWKLDDSVQGTATTTAVDSGTSSALKNGTLTNFGATSGHLTNASDWNNGTLDLDNELTIAANGTLSAPRGTLDIGGTAGNQGADFHGTLVHNNGTVLFTGGSGGIETYATGNPAFYNVTTNTDSNATEWQIFDSVTVEKALTLTTGDLVMRTTGTTLTLGTTTSAGSFATTGNGTLLTHDGPSTIQGASSLYPAVCTGTDWNWGYSAPETINLANIDYQIAAVMDGSSTAITLTGDCEFDAVTVSSGTTLDLNGQRFSYGSVDNGQFITNGSGNALLVGNNASGGFNSSPHSTNLDDCDHIVGGTGTNDLGTHRTTMYNFGSGTDEIYNWGKNGYYPNIIIGSGTVRFRNSHANYLDNDCTNLTIATGGILDWGTNAHADSKITCSGDFTTSGGLLGASCLELNGSSEYATTSAQTWGFGTAYTIETWFNSAVNSSQQTLFDIVSSGSSNRIFMLFNTSGYPKLYLGDSAGNYDVSGVDIGSTDICDGKWHHMALTNSGSVVKLYIDGKQIYENTVTVDRAADPSSQTLTLGRDEGDDDEYFAGKIDEFRIFSDVRTEAEIRADMFQGGTLANSGNLIARYSFDEGTSTAIDNSQGTAGRDLVLSDAGGWAGAGTFTQGTSTLVMAKSGTQYLNFIHGEDVYNLTINDGSTTELVCTDEVAGTLDMYGDLVVNEKLRSASSGSTNTRIKMREEKTVTVGSDVRTTALSDLYSLSINHSSGTISIPECTIPRIYCNSSTTQATGDLTITEELEVNSGTTFNANGNTIALKDLDLNTGGTLDISNSALNFSVTSSGDDCHLGQGTLLTGNTTITGYSSAAKTTLTARSDIGFEVVGDVKWLDLVNEDGELTVIGAVIDCSTSHTGARFIQWHHTLDTQQLLDADSAGDDDLRLTKPALDNSHELMTG